MSGVQVLLLRGVNVGGHGRLPMADLRVVLEALGARDVRTYIQSGNAVFRGALDAETIAAAIEARAGFRPGAIMLSREALADTIAANPFPEAEQTPKALHLAFLAADPRPAAGALDAAAAADERWHLDNRVAYLHCPSGLGRSKLAGSLERLLGVPVTARNWATITRLAALAGAP